MNENSFRDLPPLPEKFVESLKTYFPDKADSIVKSLGMQPITSIRINERKKYCDINFGEPVKWCKSGYYLSERPAFTLNPLFHAGTFYVQEAASMIHQLIIEQIAQSPVSLLDLCAAPGGKTTAAINALPDGSLVVANEFVSSRANILAENITKWGYPSTIVTNSPVEAFGRLNNVFDIIIADVPCSGEGMMRKEEVARTQWSEKLVNDCASLQRNIVSTSLPALKPGGFLIYSTCTFNPIENEMNVKWLCDNFDLESMEIKMPYDCGISPSIVPDIYAIRFSPDSTKSEGLFVALLRKKGSSLEQIISKQKKNSKLLKDVLSKSYVKNPEKYYLMEENNTIYAIPHNLLPILEKIEAIKGIRILTKGVEVASIKGSDVIPSQALANSLIINEDAFQCVDVDIETALSYLRRDAIILSPEIARGFILLKYRGIPLGFVKNLGNRANNLYPQHWRIRNSKK